MGSIDVDEQEQLLDAEFKNWDELHLPHPRDVYKVDIFHLTCRIDALTELLVEKELIDSSEYTALIYKHLREKMEMMKPELTKMLRDAKIAPNNGTKLFGPDGRPLI